jgi:spoIIIJ-associated protein
MMHREDVQNLIEEVLAKLTVAFDEVVFVDSGFHPTFLIRTSESGALIGQGGENLRALNLIVKKIAEKKFGEENVKFLIDVNSYHERRIEEIKKQAQLLAERARAFQHDVEMVPMNSFERMIIHSIFSDTPDIKTHSEGEGRFRRVIIHYVEKEEEANSSFSSLNS